MPSPSTTANKPFDDKRVRQTINYAIDTDLIIKRLIQGQAHRAVSWLPSPRRLRQASALAMTTIREAKKLLAEAGRIQRLRVRG